MSSAEREAVQAGLDAVRAHADRVAPEALLDDAAQLLQVRGLLFDEARLRRALTDPGRDAGARAELATRLFSDKVSAGVLEVAVALVRQRWSVPSGLLTGLEATAVDALLKAGSAQGLLEEVEDELFRFSRLVDGDTELSAALGNSSAPKAAREQLVHDLLSAKAKDITVRLAKLAATRYEGRGFESALHRLLQLSADKREQSIAYVTTAAALPDDQEARLAERFTEIYGRQVSVKGVVDPQVVGGIKVQIGHNLYDGTAARQLAEARKALAARG